MFHLNVLLNSYLKEYAIDIVLYALSYTRTMVYNAYFNNDIFKIYVICSLYSVICSLYSVICSQYSAISSLYSVIFSQYPVICSLYSVICSLYIHLGVYFSGLLINVVLVTI